MTTGCSESILNLSSAILRMTDQSLCHVRVSYPDEFLVLLSTRLSVYNIYTNHVNCLPEQKYRNVTI